jgi:hypothetical protein
MIDRPEQEGAIQPTITARLIQLRTQAAHYLPAFVNQFVARRLQYLMFFFGSAGTSVNSLGLIFRMY